MLTASVSVAPGGSRILAEVLYIGPAGMTDVPYMLTVRIISSEKTGDFPDFIKDKKGQSVDLYTKDEVRGLKKGDVISARVRYAGGAKRTLLRATDLSKRSK